jgi:hypothetical protein
MLTAALWIPYVVCQVMTNGLLAPANYVDPTSRPVPLWGKRAEADRAVRIATAGPQAGNYRPTAPRRLHT